MKPAFILALPLSIFATSAMADDNPAFKVIEITSAGKHAQLKPILMTLVKIQRVPVKKD